MQVRQVMRHRRSGKLLYHGNTLLNKEIMRAWRFSPTPLRSATESMLKPLSCSLGPIPLASSRWGLWMAPAVSSTSPPGATDTLDLAPVAWIGVPGCTHFSTLTMHGCSLYAVHMLALYAPVAVTSVLNMPETNPSGDRAGLV